jgi:sec-independent protein translocase protein TatB
MPEAPTPETFSEAEAHIAAEPLAVTREIQPAAAPQNAAPTEPDQLKDAKAS